MYEMLKHAHSGFRWIVLILLLITIFNAFNKRKGTRVWSDTDQKIALFAFISTHIQLVLGLILYFLSPYVSFESGFMKDSVLRFYTIEHLLMMLIGITVITIGYLRSKKAAEGKKAKTIFTYFLIGLILILLRIPWPGMGLSSGWF